MNNKHVNVMARGVLVSPAPLRAPPRENSIAIKGCIDPSNQLKITVKRTTSSLSIMNLAHLDASSAEPNDLCIIFDDMPISKTQVGLIKNTLAQKVLIIKKNKDDNDHQKFLELGFTQDIEVNQTRIYSYNLKTYNNKRGWNNPEGWANPENFEKFRW